jgi:hypothetical protein
MKNQSILKPAAGAVLICCALLFSQCKSKPDKEGVNRFLSGFADQVKGRQPANLQSYFDMPQKKAAVTHLINLLCNTTGVAEGSKSFFKVELNMGDHDLTDIGKDMVKVTFPLKLTNTDFESKTSTLTFKINRTTNGTYQIVDVDATRFLKDCIGYENLVRSKTLTDKDIYSPETLAAFKTAQSLLSKYDSIPWFQHMGNKTYYFVVKGNLNYDQVYAADTVATYKMGLVDADQKEVIPPGYDLLHNIGATFPNLIEAEKDHKRGFFSLTGQQVLPVEYDQVFPITNDTNLAVLRKGDDYYWWKKDYTISDKDPSIKIAALLPAIQAYGKSVKLSGTNAIQNITEINSRDEHTSIYISPSYMVDWALMPLIQYFKNPLRKNVDYDGGSELYELQFEGKADNENWLSSAFYSIRDNYLGGREGLYVHKNVLVINKHNNRIYGYDIKTDHTMEEGGSELKGVCNINNIKPINDTLFEIKVGSTYSTPMPGNNSITGGPGYHYLVLRHDKLVELPDDRVFGFTKYVKMDESYLNACYVLNDESSNNGVNLEMLRFMKNEIYGEYHYRFKDPKLAETFQYQYQYFEKKLNDNVDDSLTVIDKFNLAFINSKMTDLRKTKALAAR